MAHQLEKLKSSESPPSYNPQLIQSPTPPPYNTNYIAAPPPYKANYNQPCWKRYWKRYWFIFCMPFVFLIVFVVVHYVVNYNSQVKVTNICVWNATDSSFVNGLYSLDSKPSQSNQSTYSMAIDKSCNVGDKLYLFNSIYTLWTISSGIDNTNSTEMRGRCDEITVNLTKCSGKWNIPIGHLQKDVTVTITKQCPEVTCTSLHLIYQHVHYLPQERCSGPFIHVQNTQLPNLYKKGPVYLYFNIHLFRWICGDIDIITQSCINVSLDTDGIYGYAVKKSWFHANTLLDRDEIIIEWSNAYNASISCISPTSYPTKSPTNLPTTSPIKSPTTSPTKSPTISPTDTPTSAPTHGPTHRPTRAPTPNPTHRPTHKPTHFPTHKPTHNPTHNPTHRPTWKPTHKPTEFPTHRPTWYPTNKPTAPPGCIASDSYVLTYPDYTRKQIDDLKIDDKILSYDELKDLYIWEEILMKIHSDKRDHLFDVLVPMIKFILSNNETLTMTKNHLLFVTHNGLFSLKRADEVVIGDILKRFNGTQATYCTVIFIGNIMKYPRDVITYNGNLIINNIVISSWTETIWGESKYLGRLARFVIKHVYSYDVWRYACYLFSKLWNDYFSFDLKQTIRKFRL